MMDNKKLAELIRLMASDIESGNLTIVRFEFIDGETLLIGNSPLFDETDTSVFTRIKIDYKVVN